MQEEIAKKTKQEIHPAFKEFDEKGATGIMEGIVGKALTNSYHKRLAYLEGKKIVMLSDYAKSNKILQTQKNIGQTPFLKV